MGGHDRLDQGEAEPGAAGAGAGGVATGEPLERAGGELGGEAGPSSCTVKPSAEPVTVMVVPAGVYLPALASRLVTTWCRRAASPATLTGASGSESRHCRSASTTRASLTASSSSRDRSTRLALERPARVEAGEQQQVLDEPGHPRRLGLDLGQRGGGGLGAVARQLGVAGDGGERRTQLVGGVGDELAHLLLAAVPLVERRLDVVEHRVERRADLADLGALVGEALGHPLGQVDLAGGQGELGDAVGGAGHLAQRRQLAAYDERAGAAGDRDRQRRSRPRRW